MQSIENKILNRIYGNGRGWAFFKNDFLDLGSANSIDKSLGRLAKDGPVRRVMRGIYDYPKYSKLLKRNLGPDIDQIAHALARKHGWNIQVSGNTALNILGLSTQVPIQYLYMSDGKSCRYLVVTQELRFKKTRLKEIGLKYPESELLVQAVKAHGKQQLDGDAQKKVRTYFGEKSKDRILRDTRYTTTWIYEEIKRVFKEG
jgi:hypothetical protein